ncbi:MAG: hypothetical protein ACE5EK_01750 [Nitrospinales bacterium]
MRTHDKRLDKLEQRNHYRSDGCIKVIWERYRGQPLEEAMEEAGLTSIRDDDLVYFVRFVEPKKGCGEDMETRPLQPKTLGRP